MSPVERYALCLMEWNERDWRAEQLRAADAELDAQKQEQEQDASKLDTMAEEIEAAASSTRQQQPPAAAAAAQQDKKKLTGNARTRSQVDVSIDLWKLDKRASSNNAQR